MDNFNLKKYLAESKLFEERKDIGTPEELKSFLYSRQSDIVGWVKEAIENHGEENISWEEDIKQWIADDAGEITPAKFQLTYNDTTYDGYDEYMFESVYEEFVQSTYNKFFGKTAEYDENQLELAEGKLLKEELEVGTTIEINPSSFPNFEFPYGTRGEISSIDTADHASDDLVYTVKLKHIDSQGTTNDTLHIENPNQYLDEGKLLKEEGKTLVYIVVEEGDNNQYTLSDMKVFSNRSDADDYADTLMYGGTMVFQMEVI